MRGAVATFGPLVCAGCASAAPGGWERVADAPVARTEVAAATVGTRVAVIGGLEASGRATARVDL